MHVVPIQHNILNYDCVNFELNIDFQVKTVQNILKIMNIKYDESNRVDMIFKWTSTTLH